MPLGIEAGHQHAVVPGDRLHALHQGLKQPVGVVGCRQLRKPATHRGQQATLAAARVQRLDLDEYALALSMEIDLQAPHLARYPPRDHHGGRKLGTPLQLSTQPLPEGMAQHFSGPVRQGGAGRHPGHLGEVVAGLQDLAQVRGKHQ